MEEKKVNLNDYAEIASRRHYATVHSIKSKHSTLSYRKTPSPLSLLMLTASIAERRPFSAPFMFDAIAWFFFLAVSHDEIVLFLTFQSKLYNQKRRQNTIVSYKKAKGGFILHPASGIRKKSIFRFLIRQVVRQSGTG
uniref:Uncharacterized protein n=1 Tax=Romanomermis culicivorax TaxID=13658 RepID=A0A915HII4_ROMCU